MSLACFGIQLFESYILIYYFKDYSTVKEPNKKLPRVKWQYLEDFSGIFLKKIETFCADIIRVLVRDQSKTSHAISHLEFFFKKL